MCLAASFHLTVVLVHKHGSELIPFQLTYYFALEQTIDKISSSINRHASLNFVFSYIFIISVFAEISYFKNLAISVSRGCLPTLTKSIFTETYTLITLSVFVKLPEWK